MAHNYYLLNGNKGKGNSLNLLVDGKLRKNFIDISTLDLETVKIPKKNAKEILQEYNPNINLSGMFYNASYPHSKTKTKSYATIFNYEDEKTKYYYDKLRYFAEQRNYKKQHKQRIKLDETKELEEYIRKIIYNIIYSNNYRLTDYESLISAKLKSIIRDKYYNYSNTGINNYINSKIYILKSILSNYTELRNITLEYILYLQGLNTNIRTNIKRTELWDNQGLEPTIPIDYIKGQAIKDEPIYKQMELSDYIEGFPKLKTLTKK